MISEDLLFLFVRLLRELIFLMSFSFSHQRKFYYSTLRNRKEHTYFDNINYDNIKILLNIFLFLRECLRLLVVGYCYLFDESF